MNNQVLEALSPRNAKCLACFGIQKPMRCIWISFNQQLLFRSMAGPLPGRETKVDPSKRTVCAGYTVRAAQRLGNETSLSIAMAVDSGLDCL